MSLLPSSLGVNQCPRGQQPGNTFSSAGSPCSALGLCVPGPAPSGIRPLTVSAVLALSWVHSRCLLGAGLAARKSGHEVTEGPWTHPAAPGSPSALPLDGNRAQAEAAAGDGGREAEEVSEAGVSAPARAREQGSVI